MIITYDLVNNKNRASVHRFLSDWGLNSQKSVFEMVVTDTEAKKILDFLKESAVEKNDSIRIYEICRGCLRKASVLGEGLRLDLNLFQVM